MLISDILVDLVDPELGPLKRSRDGLYHRANTSDSAMLSPCKHQARKLNLQPTDIVLDLGAHLGAFSFYAIQEGVQRVIAVEPAPENVALCRKNLLGFKNAEIRHGAVVADEHTEPTVKLWRTYRKQKKGTFCDSIEQKLGRKEFVEVPAIGFGALLHSTNPTILKVDVEGTEYAYNWFSLPDSIRAISLELHRNPYLEIFLARILAHGFKVTDKFKNLIGLNYILHRHERTS